MISKKTLGMVCKVLNSKLGVGTACSSVNQIKKHGSSQKDSKKGFTLVELIVVLVIIAILAAVAVPALLGYIDYTKKKSFVVDANASLKATQAAIDEVYNNSGIVIDEKRRDTAWQVAGVDKIVTNSYSEGKGYSQFKVWTVKKIDPNTTTATTDNIASYTVQYAQYNVPAKEGDYVLLYDGNEWEVFDDEAQMKASDKYSSITSVYSENVIYMWPHTPGVGTAWNEVLPVGDDWAKRETDADESETIITLYGYKLFNHGLVFSYGDNLTTDSITIKITKEAGNIIKPWTGSSWSASNNQIISSDGKTVYKITMDEGDASPFVFTNKWYINSFGSSEKCTLDELVTKTDLVGRPFGSNNKITKLYADAYIPYETRTVTFKRLNEKLYFTKDANADTVKVSFRKYLCDYEEANDFVNNSNNIIDEDGKKIGACDWENIADKAKCMPDTAERKYGYSLAGWALSMVGSETTYEQVNEKVKSYEGLPEIWNKVFETGTSKEKAETYIFTGIVNQTKTVILYSGKIALFKDNSTSKKLVIHISDLNGEVDSDFDKYDESDLLPVFKVSGNRQKGWNLIKIDDKEASQEFNDRNLKPIESYVRSSEEGIKFEFMADNVEGSRTKFIENTQSNNKDSKNFCGQIAQLNDGARNANLVEFSKKDYKKAITLFETYNVFAQCNIIQNLNDNDEENDDGVPCGSSHYKVYSVNIPITDGEYGVSGTLKKVIVFWDGNDSTYYVPAFGYSIKDSNGKNHAFWFSREDNPELKGNFKHMFIDMTQVDFSNSHMGDWNTSTCTNMSSMFENSSLNTNDFQNQINSWDFRSVETMQNMFSKCPNLGEVNFTGKTMDKLTNVTGIFDSCKHLTTVRFTTCSMQNLKSLNNMFGSYAGDSSTNIQYFYATEWDIRSVESLKGLFTRNVDTNYNGRISARRPYSEVVDVNKGVDAATAANNVLLNNVVEEHIFDTNNGAWSATATTTTSSSKLKVANFKESNISSVTDLSSMFSHCAELTEVSFENTDLTNIKDMSQMFWHCFKLRSVSFKNIKETHPEKFYRIFDMCMSLQTIELDLEYDETENRMKTKTLMTDKVTDMRNVFYSCISLKDTYYSYFDFSSCTAARRMLFAVEFKDNNTASYKPIIFENVNMNKLETADQMFGQIKTERLSLNGCQFNSLTSAPGLFTYLKIIAPDDKEAILSMDGCYMPRLSNPTQMFSNFNGDKSCMEKFSGIGWNVSGAQSMKELFQNQKSLKEIDLTGANFGSVTNNEKAFLGCDNLETIRLSNCDMHSLTNFNSFSNTIKSVKYFYADGWDIRSVTSLKNLFNYDSTNQRELKEVDFTGAHFDSVKSMYQMFRNCSKLDTVTGLDTVSVKSLEDAQNMFINCTSLTSITMNIYSEGMTDKQVKLDNMFSGCSSLESISFVGLGNADHSVNVNQIYSFKYFINGCTSYDKEALEHTLSNWNFDTDVAIPNNGKLFESYKTGDGYNTPFENGKCHPSLNNPNSKMTINPTNNPQTLELWGNYGNGRSRRLNLYVSDKYN